MLRGIKQRRPVTVVPSAVPTRLELIAGSPRAMPLKELLWIIVAI